MKIKQVKGQMLISEFARRRLESLVFPGNESVRMSLQRTFPHHVICEGRETIQVANKDRSFVIAEFRRIC